MGVREAVLGVGGTLGFFAQPVALVGLAIAWAGAYDVSDGECGYQGTCSDEHVMSVFVQGWLALMCAEVVVGAVTAWVAMRRRRGIRWTAVEFAGAFVARVCAATMVGCALVWVLLAQSGVVAHFAVLRYPGADDAQGRFILTWNTDLAIAEGAVALVVRVGWYAWAVRSRRAAVKWSAANGAAALLGRRHRTGRGRPHRPHRP